MLRPPRPHVLVVEDDPAMGAMLVKDLGRRGFVVDHVLAAVDALALLQRNAYTTVVSDVRLGGMTGLELCAEVARLRPHLPFILITGFGDLDTAIEALRAGAHDFLPKPLEVEILARRISRASDHFFLRAEIARLREVPPEFGAFEGMIGISPGMQQVFSLIERIATGTAPILVLGETGTGKDLCARAIHARSTRRLGPFVVVNCGTTAESVFESWLAGGSRMAATEPRTRPGPFVEAAGGTLVLDELGDLSPRGQAALLRAMQDRAIHPAGFDREFPFDVRLVCTSRKDLTAAVARGDLREDLYYRLNVVQIDLPPLRARGFDILALATEFIRRIAFRTGRPIKSISPESAQVLLGCPWPGNVLELANAIEQSFAVSEHDEITLGDLPERLRAEASGTPAPVHTGGEPDLGRELVALDEVEKQYILKVVDAVSGNRTKAAEILRVDRKTLYTKLKTYGWRPPEGSSS